jgi:hypothetical protein
MFTLPSAAPLAAGAGARACSGARRGARAAVPKALLSCDAPARSLRLRARRAAARRAPALCTAQAVAAGTAEAHAAPAVDGLGPGKRPLHVLVAGGGIGGLVLAKGARCC